MGNRSSFLSLVAQGDRGGLTKVAVDRRRAVGKGSDFMEVCSTQGAPQGSPNKKKQVAEALLQLATLLSGLAKIAYLNGAATWATGAEAAALTLRLMALAMS